MSNLNQIIIHHNNKIIKKYNSPDKTLEKKE